MLSEPLSAPFLLGKAGNGAGPSSAPGLSSTACSPAAVRGPDLRARGCSLLQLPCTQAGPPRVQTKPPAGAHRGLGQDPDSPGSGPRVAAKLHAAAPRFSSLGRARQGGFADHSSPTLCSHLQQALPRALGRCALSDAFAAKLISCTAPLPGLSDLALPVSSTNTKCLLSDDDGMFQKV